MTTPGQAISDPSLLGPSFSGPSWARWLAVLKAAYGEPLDDTELALFQEVAERDPPTHPVKELWCIAGRRAGKDSIASAIAVSAALGDYGPFLRPGERASIMCLAVDKNQANIVHRYVAGYFASIPLLQAMVEKETNDGLELSNGVEIIVATNNYRSVRGKTLACVIADECAYWRDDSSAAPDIETYNAVMPGLVTLPNSILVGISSPHRRAGLLYERFQAAYGKNDADVLVVRGPSRTFNPMLPQSVVAKALERDPDAAGAEWLAEWRSDLSDFIDRELVESAVDAGIAVRAPASGVSYVAFADPSGGRGDSFTLAIAHMEENTAVLDCLFERRAPFNPSTVVTEVAEILRSYGLHSVVGDKAAAGWVKEAFAKVGIVYRESVRDRSSIYRDALPLFTSGRARLIDNRQMIRQFVTLERQTFKSGKDSITHPKDGHDDLSNSVAGALVLASTECCETLIGGNKIEVAKDGALPPLCDLGAVFWPMSDGRFAVVYVATPLAHQGAPPLAVILDFDIGRAGIAALPGVAARLCNLSRCLQEGQSPPNCWLFVPPAVVEHAAAAIDVAFAGREREFGFSGRMVGADAIDPEITADPQGLVYTAQMHNGLKRIRMAADAEAKCATVPLFGALAIRAGEKVDDDPLRMAFLVAVRLALGDR